MFFRRQIIQKIDVLLKLFFVKFYDDSIKILQHFETLYFSVLKYYRLIQTIQRFQSYSFSKRIVFVQSHLIRSLSISIRKRKNVRKRKNNSH